MNFAPFMSPKHWLRLQDFDVSENPALPFFWLPACATVSLCRVARQELLPLAKNGVFFFFGFASPSLGSLLWPCAVLFSSLG